MASGIKYTLKEIKKNLKTYGYELLDNKYENNRQKLNIRDNEGYLYYVQLSNILIGSKPKKFHKHNHYTILNIKLWCKINNKPFIIIENQTYEKNDKYLKWQCLEKNCGEIFNATWNSILNGTGCGICAGRQVSSSNCLATKNPELVSEWHPTKNGSLTPYDVTCGSNKEVWWQCSKNPKHEWNIRVASRTIYNSKCPYCTHVLSSDEYNLLVCNPELAKEWLYEKNDKPPEEYLPYSNAKVWWKCKECGHVWDALISNRNKIIDPRGCPECNNNSNRIGDKNPAWKGGVSSENSKIRNSLEYAEWRINVFKRDNYICQCCGDNKGGNLHAHHILNFSEYPDLRFLIANGITLCDSCHNPANINSFHNIYSTRNNTLKQLIEYYNCFHGDNFKSPFLIDLLEKGKNIMSEIDSLGLLPSPSNEKN